MYCTLIAKIGYTVLRVSLSSNACLVTFLHTSKYVRLTEMTLFTLGIDKAFLVTLRIFDSGTFSSTSSSIVNLRVFFHDVH